MTRVLRGARSRAKLLRRWERGLGMHIARTIAVIGGAVLLAGCATVAEQRKLERRVAQLEHGGGEASGARLVLPSFPPCRSSGLFHHFSSFFVIF